MKNLLTALLLTLASTQTFAAPSPFKFVASDNTEATQICLTAAEQGYFETRKIAKSSQKFSEVEFMTTKCNGQSIRQFAKKYTEVADTTFGTVTYKFETLDNSDATQICAIAAQEGLKQALNVGGQDAKYITCNGIRIQSFARKFKNS